MAIIFEDNYFINESFLNKKNKKNKKQKTFIKKIRCCLFNFLDSALG